MYKFKQSGMTLVGYALSVFIIAFVGLLIVRITPTYIQHYTVVRSLKDLKDLSVSKQAMSPQSAARYLRRTLLRQLSINGITAVTTKNITIKGNTKGYDVQLDYSVRLKLVANVDAVIHFENSVLVLRHGS